MKESFVFYRSFFVAIKNLDDKKRLRMFDLIANYALDSEEIDTKYEICEQLFALIKPQILANNKRYADGQKGGRPRKNKTTGFENEKTTGYIEKKPNENVNENVNVNVNENAENKTNILHISPKPKKEEIQKFAKEIMSKVDIDYFFQYYEASDWCDQYGARINWKQKLMNWSVKEKTKPKEATNGQQPYNPYL